MSSAIRIVLTGIVVFLAVSAHAQSIITFDPPGSIKTEPSSINNAGTVTGTYFTSPGNTIGGSHGFIRDAQGTITSFDVPGSTVTGTWSVAINNAGAVTGYYRDGVGFHGFIRDAQGKIDKERRQSIIAGEPLLYLLRSSGTLRRQPSRLPSS